MLFEYEVVSHVLLIPCSFITDSLLLVVPFSQGIVALFLGRLATALLAVMDMNGLFRWRKGGSKENRTQA